MNERNEPGEKANNSQVMTAQLDYTSIRSLTFCPLCNEHKETGSLVCWLCYREKGLRYGNPQVEIFLYKVEEAHRAHEIQNGQMYGAQKLDIEQGDGDCKLNNRSQNHAQNFSGDSSRRSFNESPDNAHKETLNNSITGPVVAGDEAPVSLNDHKT